MSKCPQCFNALPPQPNALVCTGTCAPTHDDGASLLLGFSVLVRPTLSVASTEGPLGLPQAVCTACGIATTTEACPHCRYEIPPLWRQSVVTCIAMAGARTTGKSLLVATGKMQLDLLADRQWRSVVEPLGSTARRYEEIYNRPLLEQRRLVQATDSVDRETSATREPLMFRFTERVNGTETPRILVLKDVAGEDLENPDKDRRQFSFFSRADAVFVMVDPLKIAEIRSVLADLIPSARRLGGDALPVLNHVFAHMTGHVPGARTDIPVALIVSKFDVMQKLRDVSSPRWAAIMARAGSAMLRDPALASPEYDARDGGLLHEEVRSLLELLGASTLVSTLMARASRHRFFVASALGDSPDDELVNAGGIAPFRVLDPFKWTLSFNR